MAVAAEQFKNYVGGEWTDAASGETFESKVPATGETLGTFPRSTAEDVDRAVAAAKAAFEEWRLVPAPERGNVLFRFARLLEEQKDELTELMSREMGKVLAEAGGDVQEAIDMSVYMAGEGRRLFGHTTPSELRDKFQMSVRMPVGVVGAITPWNFPIAIPAWKLAPALIYGNTVVLKLAYEAPRTGLHIAEAFAEAELPAGVLNVLTGRGSTAGAALVSDPRVRAISFTGSVATGHSVRDEATKHGKRVQLELGGHNPLIVTADADVGRAVEAAYAGAFWSAGQKCTATRRIYVQDAVYDTFKEQLLARVERGKVGDPLDPDVEVGPIVNETQFDEIVEAIERGKRDGGSVLTGGERVDDEAYLIAPTVFEGVADDAFLSCEEVFGPVTSLYRYSTLDEALRRANDTEFGLAAAIFTSNLADAARFQNEAQAGLLHVNSQTAGADVHVPFGGIKSSGFGPHEQGRAAIEFYTETVTIYVDP
jgi:alpha-ketoglutaric semialdehyde dehydrogenase